MQNNNTLAIGYENFAQNFGTYDLTNVTFAAGTPGSYFYLSVDPLTNAAMVMPSNFIVWTGASGTNFGTGTNWNFGGVAPGKTSNAVFNNGTGDTISGSGSVELLWFLNTGTWSLAPGTALTASLDIVVGAGNGRTFSAGNLAIDSGGPLSSGGIIRIGNGGITLGDGGSFNNSGNVSTLTVSSGGVLQDTAPPNTAEYLMEVGTDGAPAAVVVTGGLVDFGLNGVEIGDGGGSGTVIVLQGGTFIAGTANSNDNDSMAIGRTGNGTVIVTGSRSEVEAFGIAYISHSGSGDLLAENSGTFLAALDPVGLAGLLIGDGSTVGVGGLATATVTTDGVLASQGYLIVGKAGTQGQLSVIDGGTVEVGTSLVVGDTGVLNGTTYDGNGSVDIGAGGTVDLTYNGTVISAGSTTVTGGALIAGENAGSIGTVVVAGTGALLTAASAIHIGQSGQGTLDVLNGCKVEITNTSVGNLDLGGSGGGPEGGTGTVAVSGGGSVEADARL